MSIFLNLIKKEALQIVRDRRTMLITLLIPLALLLLFGFAISTEVNNVRIAMAVDRHTDFTRSLASRMSADSYFSYLGTVPATEANALLRKGKADAVLIVNEQDDAAQPKLQIIVDASNPTVGQTATNYIQNLTTKGGTDAAVVHTLYNPQMKSAYNFVPGIMGMIFILICAIMTSVSIVREKESGTMNLLLVSPVNPRIIIFGKLIPYLALSCCILAIILTLAYTVLGLPVSATIISVILISLIYIALSLSIGLLVSTIVATQVSALIVSAIIFMMPVLLLSGMIFPIENMPVFFQYFSGIIPARWYIAAMRSLMIQQLPLYAVAKEAVILAGMCAVILALAIRNFNKKS